MSIERVDGEHESKFLEPLLDFRSAEAGRKLVRLGATVLIMTGVVMAADENKENDLGALGIALAGMGTALFSDKRSTDALDKLVTLVERKDVESIEE